MGPLHRPFIAHHCPPLLFVLFLGACLIVCEQWKAWKRKPRNSRNEPAKIQSTTTTGRTKESGVRTTKATVQTFAKNKCNTLYKLRSTLYSVLRGPQVPFCRLPLSSFPLLSFPLFRSLGICFLSFFYPRRSCLSASLAHSGNSTSSAPSPLSLPFSLFVLCTLVTHPCDGENAQTATRNEFSKGKV